MREKERQKLRQMNDSEYFTRPEIFGLLTALLRNMTKKRLSVTLVCEDERVAYTSGKRTVINVLNQLTQGYALRADKLMTLMGLVGHEAGHILYSDFELLEEFLNGLEDGSFLANVSVKANYQDAMDEIKQYYQDNGKATGKVLAFYGKEALNIIEDGFVNRKVIDKYSGNVAKGLTMVIEKTLEDYPPAEKLLEEPLSGLLGIVHQYVLGGSFLGNAGTYQDRAMEMTSLVKPVLNKSKADKRANVAFQLLLCVWPELKTVIDETVVSDKFEKSDIAQQARTFFGGLSGDMPVIAKGDLVSIRGGSGGDYANVLSDDNIQSVVNEMIANGLMRDDRIKTLTQEHTSFGMNAADNTSVTINAIPDIPDDANEKVLQMREKLRSHIRRMVESTRHLLEEQEGGILDGQICGGKIGGKLYRRDQKIFTKNLMPGPDISMAVTILVDESGSMACCDERNLKAAREMAFMAYQFCRQLDIPVSVVGHGVANQEIKLDIITDFEVAPDDERCIATIGSHHNNYDAYAVEYVGKRLLNRTEDIKVLFVVSDGEPSYPRGISMHERIDAIRDIVGRLRKRGVIVIATAMDMELSDVQEIYDKDCMLISDMSRVPAIFPRLLTKYLR